MLGYLPYERLGQRDVTRPFKAFSHNPMSLPSSTALYPTTPTTGLSAYSPLNSMDYRPPPTYDVAGNLMDLSNATPAGNVKVEDYYMSHGSMPPHYGYGHGHGHNQSLSHGHSQPTGPVTPKATSPHQMPMHNSMPQSQAMPAEEPQVLNITPINGEPRNGSQLSSGSSSSSSGSDMSKIPPKKRPLSVPDEQKDATYWDKRKKNNESAKRSREQRRMKEEQIAMRVVYLEQENLQLRTEVSLLKTEIEKLRCMLYNS